jgi:hypothetical protein
MAYGLRGAERTGEQLTPAREANIPKSRIETKENTLVARNMSHFK